MLIRELRAYHHQDRRPAVMTLPQLAQIRTMLEVAHKIAPGQPTIVAGDFNSQPGSAVHRFCAAGALALAVEDRRLLSGQDSGTYSSKVSARSCVTRVDCMTYCAGGRQGSLQMQASMLAAP